MSETCSSTSFQFLLPTPEASTDPTDKLRWTEASTTPMDKLRWNDTDPTPMVKLRWTDEKEDGSLKEKMVENGCKKHC